VCLAFCSSRATQPPAPSIVLDGVATKPLVYKGTARRMDGISITECEPHIMFRDAVTLLMAAYFVYGIEYPQQLKHLLIFIDNWIINIEESKLPTTLLRMKQLL